MDFKFGTGPALGLVLACFLAFGIGGSFVLGASVESQARSAWHARARQDAVRLTELANIGLAQAQASLRGLAATFYSGGNVEARDFTIAAATAQGWDVEIKFDAIAHARRVTRAQRKALETELAGPLTVVGKPDVEAPDVYESFGVTLTSQAEGVLALGSDLTTLDAMRAVVATAYRTPTSVVTSPAFLRDGRHWVVMGFAAPNDGHPGVIIGLLDLTDFFQRVLALAPAGLELRLSQRESDWGASGHAGAVVGPLERPPGVVETFQFRVVYGQARWLFGWDLYPGYESGASLIVGRLIEIGGTLLTALGVALIGGLAIQNAGIRRRVLDKTGELVAARDEAELANRSKTAFLANVSHELRTPLNAIIGFSELLGKEMLGPLGNKRYREYANDIHDSGLHLLSLINDILDLSKIEAGRYEIREDEVYLFDAVRSSLRLVESKAEETGLTLIDTVSSQLPPLIADRRVIRQILLNLLSNAVKFTPAGGRVCVSAEIDRNGGLVLAVSDTGIGMSEEEQYTAMVSFAQVDSSLSRTHEGTGLGLPLTKRLVELHGGAMTISSKPNEGTTVSIVFGRERVIYGASEAAVA
ncbi:MAG: sensor histidine kinase [Alphaproteobacteria bacterium]